MRIVEPSSDFKTILACKPILPSREMAEYEALWAHQKATFKSIADFFRNCSLSLGGRTQVASITEKSSEGTRQSCLVCIEPLNEKPTSSRMSVFRIFSVLHVITCKGNQVTC